MTTNFFANSDKDYPSIDLKLPKIRQNLPRITQMKESDEVVFEIDENQLSLEEIAEKLGKFYG